MASARVRLILSAVFFGGWLAYLGWLAWTYARPHVSVQPEFEIAKARYQVLSRSQFLEADMDLSVLIDDDGKVTEVREVLWSADGTQNPDLRDVNLSRARKDSDLEGHGPFLVPMTRTGGKLQPAKVPLMPGAQRENKLPPEEGVDKYRIYHDTPQARAQEREIRKKY